MNVTFKGEGGTAQLDNLARSPQRSLGGISLLLLGWSITAGSAVSKLIDNESRVYSDDRSSIQVSESNYGGLVGVGFFWLAVVIAVVCIFRRSNATQRFSILPLTMFLAVGWWLLCSMFLQEESAPTNENLPFLIGIMLVAVAVVKDPPSLASLNSFNWIRDSASALMLIASFVDPATSQLPCRADKCGLFDSLFLGFFYSENSAAQFILLLVPAAITIRSRTYLISSLLLAGTFLAATGSRTSLIDFIVVVIFIAVYRRSVLRRFNSRVWFPWRLVPGVFFGASFFVFLAYSSGELTGRGAIYEGIRAQLQGSSLLVGSGPETMERVFAAGLLGHFEAFGEHGQAPHLIAQAGVPALVLFGIGLYSLALNRAAWTPREIAGFALILAGSLQFVTEPGWTLNPRTLNLAVMLLAISLFVRSDENVSNSGSSARGRGAMR